MSYEYLLGMGTETQQAAGSAAALEQVSVTAPVANDEEDARQQLLIYQYLQGIELVRKGETDAREQLQAFVRQPETVQTLQTCSELDSGQRTPSFPTPEAQERYQQLCLAAKWARDTAVGKDPLVEELTGAMKIGAVFGSIATIAGGFALYGLYSKYKKYKKKLQSLAEKTGGET